MERSAQCEGTHVEQDPLVGIAVRAGEADEIGVGRDVAAAVIDLDLRAGGVEVRTAFRGCVRE